MIRKLAWNRWRRLSLAMVGLAVLGLLSEITPSFGNQQSTGYVGLRYRELPAGLQGGGGWLVGSGNRNGELAVTKISKGSQQMLWLETVVAYDSTGKAQYQVIDVLTLPPLASSEEIAGGSGYYCRINGKYDPELVTIAKTESDTVQYMKRIRKAWRANRSTGRFEEIAPRNIACENPGWGL